MKDLITELEDAIRVQKRRKRANPNGERWDKDRKAFINMAAWLMTVVQAGDEDAAKAQKDPGTTG